MYRDLLQCIYKASCCYETAEGNGQQAFPCYIRWVWPNPPPPYTYIHGHNTDVHRSILRGFLNLERMQYKVMLIATSMLISRRLDLLSINNPEFENYLDHMYPVVREIKDTQRSNSSVSNLDLLLSIRRDGKLHTNKRDDFNFHITNFLYLSSNIPSSPAYGVLSHCYTWGHPPNMDVLLWGQRDIPIS